MISRRIMVIAGETSGDMLAADLVDAMRAITANSARRDLSLQFFGAGGPRMAAAGVELAVDMTPHAVTGLWEVLKRYGKFKDLLNTLFRLAVERKPDLIICVDYSGFNRRLAQKIKDHLRANPGNWNPKIIQYVSPQVWASRPGRANKMPAAYDLLLTIFPFEKDWYAARVPELKVRFVGNPILDRFKTSATQPPSEKAPPKPLLLLLPGSRPGELRQHLPVLLPALELIRSKRPDIHARLILPDQNLLEQARAMGLPSDLEVQVGGLAQSLMHAEAAIASTGTVTMECAYFGVPTVALYKTSWATYQIGKRLITVDYMAMPNILAGEQVFPEFLQYAATPENISRAALELLGDKSRQLELKTKLKDIIASLGMGGANHRAAEAILELL
jgi:lipid-A-disaccharide synthase